MPLERERRYFENQRAEWAEQHEGLFVLLKDENVAGFFATEEEAFKEGLARFGTDGFLVKQVLKDEPKVFMPFFSSSRARL
jgi:hypothetical protein